MSRLQKVSCCLLLVLDFALLCVTLGILVENVTVLLVASFGLGWIHGETVRMVWRAKGDQPWALVDGKPYSIDIKTGTQASIGFKQLDTAPPSCHCYDPYDNRDFTPSFPDVMFSVPDERAPDQRVK